MNRPQRWFPEFGAAARGGRHSPPKPWMLWLAGVFLVILPFAPLLARWLAALTS